MNYNQRNDYRVSRETALGWWKGMTTEGLLIRGVAGDAQTVEPEKGVQGSNGLWMILTLGYSDLAAVVAQPLTDNSGERGLAVLRYDREKYSRLSRVLKYSKLSRSKEVAMLIEKVLLQRGDRAFPLADQPVNRT